MSISISTRIGHLLSMNVGACSIVAALSLITPTPAPAQDCKWECATCTCNLQTGKCVCSDCTVTCTK